MRLTLPTTLFAAVLATASIATADAINWTLNANGSWADAGNWDTTPAFDGTEDVNFIGTVAGITGHRTASLNGDRDINSLNLDYSGVGHRFTLQSGSPNTSVLTIRSGNITSYGGTANYIQTNTPNLIVQVGDGITPVTDAVWNYSSDAAQRGTGEFGEFRGIADTVVTLQGNSSMTFTRSSPQYHGTLVLDQDISVNPRINVRQNDSLGAGTVEYANVGALLFDDGSGDPSIRTHQANFAFTGALAHLVASNDDVVVLTGDLSGSGDVNVNRAAGASTVWYGTLIHDGNSTLSGDVLVAAGTLLINGTWTGAGDVTAAPLQSWQGLAAGRGLAIGGSGHLGLASGKSLNVFDGGSGTYEPILVPGGESEVGTFTVGTDGNGNAVILGNKSSLVIDIDGASSDRLDVLGDLDLTSLTNALVFNELSTPTAGFYTLATYTGNLTGEFSSVMGLPDGYELDYSTQGQINLIPEPASMALLGLGGLVMLSARRRRA